jgi:hypothetical protein
MGCNGEMKVEEKLRLLGYRKRRGNTWVNGTRKVNVQHSVEYDRYHLRVVWYDKWVNYHALIFDYSAAQGPVCIVPTNILFKNSFITEKRMEDSYANSGNYWSQPFPIDHEIASLILEYADRWDLL